MPGRVAIIAAMRAVALRVPRHLPSVDRLGSRLLGPPAILVATMAAFVVVVPPVGEFPIDDDWHYAALVQSLLAQGYLVLSSWTAPSLVFQAYWGALFAHLFGFSHTTLRASTLLLSAVAVLGCYALLRDLLDRPRALLGASALLVNPLYVFCSYSFNTYVPFLAFALWALVCNARALREASPHPGWLAAGALFAAGAYLVRQVGAVLPLAVVGALLLSGNWRMAFRPRYLAAVLGPFVPALLIGAYFDAQRDPLKQQPVAWTLDFWAGHGPGLVGVALARLAGTFSTMGLFTLPVTVGALLGGVTLRFSRRRFWLAAILLMALLVGFVIRSTVFGQRLLFPHLGNVLYPRGFQGLAFQGTLPESIVLPEAVLVGVTVAAIVGAGLLVVLIAATSWPRTIRGPIAVPLLFGLLALGLTALYYAFYETYLLAVMPSLLLVTLLPFRGNCPGRALAVAGVVVLAAWSIWWEREYLERRAALWQVGLELVARGIPPEQIDGGFEWNGWHRGQGVIAAAVQDAQADTSERQLEKTILRSLMRDTSRWAVAYSEPKTAPGRVISVVSYGRGQRVVAVERS
jgi:4-amino-4-deoxy-L-arabinose transferase-like glycosyltransferase